MIEVRSGPGLIGDPRFGELARAALALDADEAPPLVARLSEPPAGRRWTVLATPDRAGAVFTSLAETSDGVAGHVDLLAVHPSARGRGLGRALVGAAEEWARAAGAREMRFAGNPPCYAWPGIDVRYTPAACLAESLGYERYHVAWNMTVDLPVDLPPEPLAPGVTVRAAAPGERAEVTGFVHTHWNDSWAWEVAQATGCHYAERDGEILGFAAWGARPSWFGPMGTAPAARGLGIGRILLRHCLAEQAAAGQRSAQIGWVGPLRFYSRAVGARAERVFWLYRRTFD